MNPRIELCAEVLSSKAKGGTSGPSASLKAANKEGRQR